MLHALAGGAALWVNDEGARLCNARGVVKQWAAAPDVPDVYPGVDELAFHACALDVCALEDPPRVALLIGSGVMRLEQTAPPNADGYAPRDWRRRLASASVVLVDVASGETHRERDAGGDDHARLFAFDTASGADGVYARANRRLAFIGASSADDRDYDDAVAPHFFALAGNDNGVVVAGRETGLVRLTRDREGAPLACAYRRESLAVDAAAFAKNTKRVALISIDERGIRNLAIWDVERGVEKRRLRNEHVLATARREARHTRLGDRVWCDPALRRVLLSLSEGLCTVSATTGKDQQLCRLGYGVQNLVLDDALAYATYRTGNARDGFINVLRSLDGETLAQARSRSRPCFARNGAGPAVIVDEHRALAILQKGGAERVPGPTGLVDIGPSAAGVVAVDGGGRVEHIPIPEP